jgi:hypothetical protein
VSIALLYIFSVPWYRETGAPFEIWFGLPDWVAVALLCYAIAACFNAVAWLLADVSDELDPADVGYAGELDSDPRALIPSDVRSNGPSE